MKPTITPIRSNTPLAAGEAALSAAAKHAYETLLYAFWLPEQSMAMGELRDALRRLYGDAVDRELEQYFYNSAAIAQANIQT